ncbi:MAG: hypothetical protein ACK2U5_21800, partial [Candidatus Promineifilaceae bacterium]
MKRWFYLLMIMALVASAAACGGSAPAETAESSQEQPAAVEETAEEATLPPPIITEQAGSVEGNAPVSEGEAEPEQPASEEPGQDEPVEEPVEEAATPETPWPVDEFGYGVQIHGNATVGDPADTMRAVKNDLGVDWVKTQIQWWLIHPDPDVEQWFFYDGVIDQAHENDLRLMVSVVGAPAWTRSDGTENGPPDDYGQ